MQITIQQDVPVDLPHLEQMVREVITFEGQQCDEVAIYFVDGPKICALHETFFDDPAITDCISFPLDGPDEPYRVLGEVFVCPEVALQYTQEQGGCPQKETILYMVHGLLHLMGYDDIEESDRVEMRAAEQRHLSHLLQCGLLPDSGSSAETA